MGFSDDAQDMFIQLREVADKLQQVEMDLQAEKNVRRDLQQKTRILESQIKEMVSPFLVLGFRNLHNQRR